MHLTSIKKEYGKDQNLEKLKHNKQRLIKYYESGEFEEEVERICQNALVQLASIAKTENSAVIFDVDETCLSHYPLCKEKDFVWSLDNDIIPYRQKAICPAIKPVLKFFQSIKKANYKIIFITSRRDLTYEATLKNLVKEGFINFDELILLPMSLFQKGIKHELWKAEVRKELAKKYTIDASISDSQKDFEGGNTGYCIKIPNYLY